MVPTQDPVITPSTTHGELYNHRGCHSIVAGLCIKINQATIPYLSINKTKNTSEDRLLKQIKWYLVRQVELSNYIFLSVDNKMCIITIYI